MDQKPQYKGGFSGLAADINAAYKPDMEIDGVVHVQFVVNCKGQVFGVTISRGLNKQIDTRITKELLLLQNWQPGYQQVPVDCSMRLSVKIKSGEITVTETS